MKKQDTKHRKAIPVIVQVYCTLYKLLQRTSILLCSNRFALGVTIVCEILKDVMKAINVIFRHEMEWPTGNWMLKVMAQFERYCSLLEVVRVIDDTHF